MNVSQYLTLCAQPCAVCGKNYGSFGEPILCPGEPKQGCKIFCEIGAGRNLQPDPPVDGAISLEEQAK